MHAISLAPAMRGCDENPPAFAASRALFEATLNGLEREAAGLSHGELEEWLDARGRELQRQMYQDSLDLRAPGGPSGNGRRCRRAVQRQRRCRPPSWAAHVAAAARSADYLIRKRPYLDYPTALKRGWPIATGVIGGRLPSPGQGPYGHHRRALGLDGAEAILKLRTLISNGDFAEYWRHHLDRERFRIHDVRYSDATIPTAA